MLCCAAVPCCAVLIHRFVDNNLVNKKTSRVLEVAFGKEWTDRYMTG